MTTDDSEGDNDDNNNNNDDDDADYINLELTDAIAFADFAEKRLRHNEEEMNSLLMNLVAGW